MSSLYDNQVVKQVANWDSTFKVQMKVQTFDPLDSFRQLDSYTLSGGLVIIEVSKKEPPCSCIGTS